MIKYFFARNIFGQSLFLKRCLIIVIGCLSHHRFFGSNKLHIKGSSILRSLPLNNVLFVSNHQTYFADAAAMLHVFNASIKGRKDTLRNISYLWNPKLNIYFIAAKETMNSGIISRILAYTGSVSIERTWRLKGKNIKRNLKKNDIVKVDQALSDGWLITFPQGTTKPKAPIRKGTSYIIKKNKPIVVPIVIDGFNKAFDKTGLRLNKKGVKKSIIIKHPLNMDYDNYTVEKIAEIIAKSIEQD
jgi:1-acyl-sn-glycerol-3-phosphate acyltransferase